MLILLCLSHQALEAHTAKFDRELLLQGKNVSDEEFERLLAAHKKEQAALEQNMDAEKERQKKALQDKVCIPQWKLQLHRHFFMCYQCRS